VQSREASPGPRANREGTRDSQVPLISVSFCTRRSARRSLYCFASRAADLFKRGEVFVAFGRLLVNKYARRRTRARRGLRIDFQRAFVVVKRFIEVADMAVGVAEIAMDVSVTLTLLAD